MGRLLSAEIPSLHHTLLSFTLARCLHINELPQFEVAWAQQVPNRKQVLWSDPELRKVLLWRQPMFQEVTELRPLDFSEPLLTAADLNGIMAILLSLFDLKNLASIHLHDGAWGLGSPPIPEMGHANFVSKQADPLRMAVDGLCRLELVVACHGIRLVLKGVEGVWLSLGWMVGGILEDLGVVDDLGEAQVILAHLAQC